MPTDVIRARLMPASFHKELVEAMTAVGFTRMYQFTATTDRDTYHVPAEYAQSTSHFFYLPDRGFVVQLTLAEHIDERYGYQSWWSGNVYLQLDVAAMIEYEVLHVCSAHPDSRFSIDACEPLEHVMGNVDELLQPFRIHGTCRLDDEQGSYGWKVEYSSGDQVLTIAQLVGLVDGLRTHFGPFLKPTLSYNFDAFCFTDTYSWPDIRERFWRSFPTRLLKQIVPGRVRGRESVQLRRR